MGVYMGLAFLLSFLFIVAPAYSSQRVFSLETQATTGLYTACLEAGVDLDGVKYPTIGRVVQPSYFIQNDKEFYLTFKTGGYIVAFAETNEIVCETPTTED